MINYIFFRNFSFLPDEMFKARKETIKIHFSKPFDSALLDKSKTDRQWSKLLQQYIYSNTGH